MYNTDVLLLGEDPWPEFENHVCCIQILTPPSWLPSLTNLASLEFRDCKRIQWLPPLNQLPNLRKLLVFSLTKLEYIHVDVNYENSASSPFFPSLTNLVVTDCPNLKGFVKGKIDDVGMKPLSIPMEVLPCFPQLSKLHIEGCPNLTFMPLFPELKTLQSGNNEVNSLISAE